MSDDSLEEVTQQLSTKNYYIRHESLYNEMRELNKVIIAGDKNAVLQCIEKLDFTPAKCGKVAYVPKILSQIRTLDELDAFPLNVAARTGRLDVLNSMIELGFDPSTLYFMKLPIHDACLSNQADVVKTLVDVHGADVEARAKTDITPLGMAIMAGSDDCITALVDRGADIDGDSRGETHLCAAIEQGDIDTVKLVIKYGASVDYGEFPYVWGNTPVHMAVYHGYYDIARYLIVDLNVRLDMANVEGETPFTQLLHHFLLDQSPYTRHVNIGTMLLDAGYIPNFEAFQYNQTQVKNSPLIRTAEGRKLLLHMRRVAMNPHLLQDICCFRLRRLVGKNIQKVTDSILLPQTLKDKVLLKHIPV